MERSRGQASVSVEEKAAVGLASEAVIGVGRVGIVRDDGHVVLVEGEACYVGTRVWLWLRLRLLHCLLQRLRHGQRHGADAAVLGHLSVTIPVDLVDRVLHCNHVGANLSPRHLRCFT